MIARRSVSRIPILPYVGKPPHWFMSDRPAPATSASCNDFPGYEGMLALVCAASHGLSSQ